MKRIDELERNQRANTQILVKIQAKLDGNLKKIEDRNNGSDSLLRVRTSPAHNM